MKNLGAKLAVSTLAFALIGLRFWRPELNVDSVTVALLVVAILPWLSSLIKSAELPGGWKIEFQDVKDAGDKVLRNVAPAVLPPTPSTDVSDAPDDMLAVTADHDAGLSLVALRIDIERRLRVLARNHKLSDREPLARLVESLRFGGVLDAAAASGLSDLIAAGNEAAHGASVAPGVLAWAHKYGRQIIERLDLLIASSTGRPNER